MEFMDATDNASCSTISEGCAILQELLATDFRNEQWKDDATWILTSSFVILTMQSGFGLLEIGASTPGNEVNTMLKNVSDILFGGLAFYMFGFAISSGSPSNGFMGTSGFFTDGSNESDADAIIDDGILYSEYLFQLSFAATSATIVSGCIAMRMKFEAYCIFAYFAVIIYSFVAHWVWAPDGWLNQHGYYDFAGGSAVHMHGAMNGLVAILFVGPRRGRFDGTRPKSDFAESSPTSMLFGLFMLWWGWIGFNCGSTFGITNEKWFVAARVGANTINASVGGGMMAIIYSKIRSRGRYVRPADIVNGILGALVSSSPTCGVVHTGESILIGAIGSLAATYTNDTIMKRWLKLDDPVGAIGVHLVGGFWGTFAVSLFADARLAGTDIISSGLFRGGGFELMGIQLMGIAAILAWSVVTMTPFFYLFGAILSRNWKDPRSGLRYDWMMDRTDPHVHKCCEDPTDHIVETINKTIERSMPMRGSTQERATRALSIMMEMPFRQSNLSQQDTDDDMSDMDIDHHSNVTSSKLVVDSSQLCEGRSHLDAKGQPIQDKCSSRKSRDDATQEDKFDASSESTPAFERRTFAVDLDC